MKSEKWNILRNWELFEENKIHFFMKKQSERLVFKILKYISNFLTIIIDYARARATISSTITVDWYTKALYSQREQIEPHNACWQSRKFVLDHIWIFTRVKRWCKEDIRSAVEMRRRKRAASEYRKGRSVDPIQKCHFTVQQYKMPLTCLWEHADVLIG